MPRFVPRALASYRLIPLALASTLLLSACFSPAPTSSEPADNVRRISATKTLAVGEGPHGITHAGGVIVNSNPKSGDITIIDPGAESTLATLTFEGGKASNSPTQAQATLDGQYAVTMDSKANLLRVIKGKNHVGTVPLGKKPGSKLVWADGQTAYLTVGEAADANVMKISWPAGFEAGAVTESLTVSRSGASAFTAGFLAVGGGYLAVPNAVDNAVSFVKLGETALTTLQEGNAPGPIGISTLGGAVLVFGNKNSNTVTLYDMVAKAKLATLQVGSTPTDMALRADGRFAYVTCAGSGEVAVIDVAERKLHSHIKVGRGLAGTPSGPVHLYAVSKAESSGTYRVSHEGHDHSATGEEIWVGGDKDASVTVIDADTQQAIAVITVGQGHHKMAFTGTKAFVSNLTENTVSVIDRHAIR